MRRRWDTRVFAAAVFLLCFHVLDDGFFRPEPGTSAGDHLLYVGVFVSLFAAGALAYARARDGVRSRSSRGDLT
ncbi:MAG: hypothetical protein M3327_04415 [Actinomycetota bacterium]|nr:hypothetical protein [Actinomycetota bacterium]